MSAVRFIHIRNFGPHSDTRLELPEKGLVVITGENGAGKSTFCEAMSVGLHNRMLRGDTEWRDGVAGGIHIAFGNTEIMRTRQAGGGMTVRHSVDGKTTKAMTPTKGQEALSSIVGSHDVWRRACTLSSADAAAFSTAPDHDRKRLIEEVMGLGAFEPALKLSRVDLAAAERDFEQAQTEWGQLSATRKHVESQLEQAHTVLADTEAGGADVARLAARAREIREVRRDAEAMVDRIREQLESVRDLVAGHRAHERLAKERLAKLGDRCPTCDQNVPPRVRGKIRSEIELHQREARTALASVGCSADGAHAALVEIKGDVADLESAERAAVGEHATARADAARVAAMRKLVETAESGATQWGEDASRCRDKLSAIEAELGIIRTAEKGLNTRGIRAHVIGEALAGLEELANDTLEMLTGGRYRIRLSAYTPSKSRAGAFQERIQLAIEGDGVGPSYKSASGGERRKIDIGLLLAFGQFARARGSWGGWDTLWLDEPFDQISRGGMPLAAQCIHQLSQERCVVLITHSDNLLGAVRSIVRSDVAYHVDGGRLV